MGTVIGDIFEKERRVTKQSLDFPKRVLAVSELQNLNIKLCHDVSDSGTVVKFDVIKEFVNFSVNIAISRQFILI